jgi:hypothetical protein
MMLARAEWSPKTPRLTLRADGADGPVTSFCNGRVLISRVSQNEAVEALKAAGLQVGVAFNIIANGKEAQFICRGGGKGRDKRPAFDALCRDANQRQFDVVMAWSVDRLDHSQIPRRSGDRAADQPPFRRRSRRVRRERLDAPRVKPSM